MSTKESFKYDLTHYFPIWHPSHFESGKKLKVAYQPLYVWRIRLWLAICVSTRFSTPLPFFFSHDCLYGHDCQPPSSGIAIPPFFAFLLIILPFLDCQSQYSYSGIAIVNPHTMLTYIPGLPILGPVTYRLGLPLICLCNTHNPWLPFRYPYIHALFRCILSLPFLNLLIF